MQRNPGIYSNNGFVCLRIEIKTLAFCLISGFSGGASGSSIVTQIGSDDYLRGIPEIIWWLYSINDESCTIVMNSNTNSGFTNTSGKYSRVYYGGFIGELERLQQEGTMSVTVTNNTNNGNAFLKTELSSVWTCLCK